MGQVRIQTEIPGPRSKELVAQEQEHLAPGLQGFALWAGVAMDTGQGSYLTDVDGNRYVISSAASASTRWATATPSTSPRSPSRPRS